MKGKQGKEEATPLFKKREPTKIIIDKKFVETNLGELIKSQDLSKFIL